VLAAVEIYSLANYSDYVRDHPSHCTETKIVCAPENVGTKLAPEHPLAVFLLIHQKERCHRADAEDP
jgi:hypothetical protein